MKVLYVPDVLDWAIGSLVKAKVKYTPQNDSRVIPIHPRDAAEKANWFLGEVKKFNPDIIVYEYFRSCEQLITSEPELKNWKSVLVHHNQRDKSLFHADWNALGIDVIVTHTAKCRHKLVAKGYANVETINHGIDLSFFEYKETEPEVPVIGYCGRIVPWKGLKEIAECAQELGYKVQVMGKPDKMDYWDTVPKEPLLFDYFKCSNEERVDAYHNMTIYVGNSEDDYEEGTLPFLEAMACGVPVVTTPNGVANDIAQPGENMLVVPFKDKVSLKAAIQKLMEDKDLRTKLRRNAWNTVKNMPEEKMAYEYTELFNKMMYKEPLVSAIIPATYDRAKYVAEILAALDTSDYKAIEAVVVWDEDKNLPDELYQELQAILNMRDLHITVKQFATGVPGYNLARARNLGVIEAQGKYLLFCDSRLKPEKDAVAFFVNTMESIDAKRAWLFGNKGSNKKSFVENFSFVRRDELIQFGMFNERIDRYGGMSQELRTRWIKQEGTLEYIESALATEMVKSGMTPKKRQDIIAMKLRLLKMYKGQAH